MTTVGKVREKISDLATLDIKQSGVAEFTDRLSWLLSHLSSGWAEERIRNERNAEQMKRLGEEHGRRANPYPASAAREMTPEEADVVEHFNKLHKFDANLTLGARDCLNGLLGKIIDLVRSCRERGNAAGRDGNFYGEHISEALIGVNTREVQKDGDGDDNRDININLDEKQKEFRATINELREFREKHVLRRPPHYEHTAEFAPLLGIYWLVEGMGNGFFYSSAIGEGLLVGWSVAFIVALIVLLFGGLAGNFARELRGLREYKNTDNDERTWARPPLLNHAAWGATTLLCLVFGVYVVAFAYLYRDAAAFLISGESGADVGVSAVRYAVERMLAFDWKPTAGIESFGIIAINLIGLGLSFWKFHWRRYDCLPGYVDLAKAVRDKRERYKDAIAKQMEDDGLDAGKIDAFKRKLNDIAIKGGDIDKLREMRGLIVIAVPQIQDTARQKAAYYTKQCKVILNAYREANMAERPKDKPEPGYFSAFPEFKANDIAALDEELVEESARVFADASATEIGNTLAEHRQKAVEIVALEIKRGRERRLDEHLAESDRYMEELTEKEREQLSRQRKRQQARAARGKRRAAAR